MPEFIFIRQKFSNIVELFAHWLTSYDETVNSCLYCLSRGVLSVRLHLQFQGQDFAVVKEVRRTVEVLQSWNITTLTTRWRQKGYFEPQLEDPWGGGGRWVFVWGDWAVREDKGRTLHFWLYDM